MRRLDELPADPLSCLSESASESDSSIFGHNDFSLSVIPSASCREACSIVHFIKAIHRHETNQRQKSGDADSEYVVSKVSLV